MRASDVLRVNDGFQMAWACTPPPSGSVNATRVENEFVTDRESPT